ncbi:zinc finger protein [Streptomyces sp. V4-01]|uniref:Zinc finger protein n=1 Tax=Actinacidiphila polyblastidii TaxID=3110430 RepID=A0ABU7PKW9_9ACTN|nr:zinc finger protein [Streptomyces sp. V4-01]
MSETDPAGPWTCETCGTDNGPDDEHCQICDQWRNEQET